MSEFTRVDERPTKWVYDLEKPVIQRYLVSGFTAADAVWGEREVSKVVVSIGRAGDSAIFPATDDGRILDFDALHTKGYWIVDPDEFMREWLEGSAR